MKKLILAILSLFIFFAAFFINPSSTLAKSWPPEVKPEQGKAWNKREVRDTYDGRVLGESYREITFWNVGQVSGNSEYAKVILSADCSKSTTPGCIAGDPIEGIFSGGPNGIITISGYEFKLHDGQYFELNSAGTTTKYTVENPEIFSKYNWDAVTDDKKSKLEDSGAAFSDLFGQVEVNIPNEDGTYDEEKWDFAKLDGKTFPVGTHIKTSEKSGGYISFADMTTYTLKPGSEIILSSPAAKDSQVKLLAGNLWINIKKMFKDGSMEIEMSQAVAGIKGTRFVLNETGTESTIMVTDGTVKYTSKNTGKSVDVSKGESVVATSKGLSEKTTFDPVAEEKIWQELANSFKKPGTDNKNVVFLLGGIGAAAIIVFLIFKARKSK